MSESNIKPYDQAPSYVKLAEQGQSAPGMEHSAGQAIIPMLCIAQPLTPAVVERKGVEAGDLFLHTEPNVPICKAGQAVKFIPAFHWLEWIEWFHRDSKLGFKDRSTDPKGSLAKRAAEQWAKRKPGTPRQLQYNPQADPSTQTHIDENQVFLILIEGHLTEPIAVPMARTKYKKGRLLLSLALRRGLNVPLYAGKYEMRTVIESNATGNKYHNFAFAPAGWAEQNEYQAGEALYKMALERYQSFQFAVADDEPATGGGDDAAAAATKEF